MPLDEAWNSGVYLPTPGGNDPPTGYSDFDRTKHPCNDSKFDYALLLCNINAAKDDEFIVCLNGYELGPIAELGVDACGGRFFATSQEIVDVIKRGQDDPECPQFEGITICCVRNTDAVTIVDKKPFMADSRIVDVDPNGNPVVTKNFFDLFMRNTKNNNNGNFGEFVIWRLSKYRSGGKTLESLCELGRGNYSGFSGEDLGPYDFGDQPLCCDPKLYPSYCCTIDGIVQCVPEKGTPAAEPADECSDYYYPPDPPPEPPPEPPPTPAICAGYCYYTWSQSDYKWILDEAISYCCKDPDNPLTGAGCDPYDPNDIGRECNCCPPVNPGLFDGAVMFGICDDISVACALPPEPPEPPPESPPESPPDPPSINCWFEWSGTVWYFRDDISFCEQICCEPTGTGSEVGQLALGTCQESCPEPPSDPPTPTCEGGCVYRWELDPGNSNGGYWALVDLASDCTCTCCPPVHVGSDGDIYIGTCQDDVCPDPPSPPPPKDPPSPCGWCAYIWDASTSSWVLDTSITNCPSPCGCSEPPYDGTFDTEMANGACTGPAPDDPDPDDPDDDPPEAACDNASCAWIFNMDPDVWSWELIFGCPAHCPGYSCNPPAPLPLDTDITDPGFFASADTPCFPP